MNSTDELRLKVAAQILTGLLIEDRIAWMKDFTCFGNPENVLIENAVDLADKLIAEIQKTSNQK